MRGDVETFVLQRALPASVGWQHSELVTISGAVRMHLALERESWVATATATLTMVVPNAMGER